jgi:glycosyltransferase involved in cell wall biosynthesis
VRIAHISDCYVPRLGGIELQVQDLAQRQAAAGHEVTVITSTVGAESGGQVDDCTVVRVGGRGGEAEDIRYFTSRHGPRAVSSGAFDVVHVHASSFSPLAFLTARDAARRGIPTVATVHSLWAKATPLFVMADRLVRWGDWPVEWSAVSNAAALPLRRIMGGRAPVTVLPNGVDPELWRTAPVERDPDEIRLAVVTRLAPRKRPLHLARMLFAARQRLPEGTRLRVDVIGDGPERVPLERYLRGHGMNGWVQLRGRLTRGEIRSTYARSDLFVAPAALESFGIAALEARCAGLPIVALSGTGVQDFVSHGTDGWLVNSDAAMVAMIVDLASSRETLDRVTAHNRAVPPSITWSGVLRSCQALYESAALRQDVPLAAGRPEMASLR